MISPQELRKTAREKMLPLDLVEKDYVLGWILYGICSSPLSNCLAFKGGTALSKIYFPGQWRLSEDLDFTLLGENNLEDFAAILSNDVPNIIAKDSNISVVLSKPPFLNPVYLQSRFQYTGPISKNTVKIEITTEKFLGEVTEQIVPNMFDYPHYLANVYTLETILAEKIRALIERGKIKDYYDVWRLLKTQKWDKVTVKEMFLRKCEAKGVVFVGVDQLFPNDIAEIFKPHLEVGLTRLSSEPLPPIDVIITETKTALTTMLS
ncbi:MAG: nucleotidyl transferase AbiEii/AbiGii toxin family protein [Nitrososphaerota archaeon]|jgi:predicted nucleotidyltransferase component of viral defense system|nr:nucleotidyl transferase AbiEii/AbiGii toxin family protein [Nitrososphaerota archaeon]